MVGFSDLWAEIRGIRTPPQPIDRIPVVPEFDDETIELEESDQAPDWAAETITGRTFWISYLDSKKQASERQVLCRRLDDKAGVLYLYAYCYIRERPRSFRADRIVAIVDTETGEVFEPGEQLLRHFLPNSASTAPFHYGLSPQQYADFNAALNVLSFMARCDGEWHQLEAEAIEDFAASYWLRAEITSPFDAAEIERHAARLAPDPETFWVSLRRCAENPILSQIIRRHISKVIDADGQHHPLELYWGQQIDDFLAA